MAVIHRPVMVGEVVSWLRPSKGTYLDVTLGDGGHSEAILMSCRESKIIGIDRDAKAMDCARNRLNKFGDRITLRSARFSKVETVLDELGVESIDGALADLGVSSRQLDVAGRGFSFQSDGPLDMRMGGSNETAADIVNGWPEEDLADLFYEYGGERKSRRIAKKICELRRKKKFSTTLELADAVMSVVPRRGSKIHPATRVFQALRIAVNEELDELDSLLDVVPEKLSSGARFAVISYHSLEDRKVKRKFRELAKCGYELPFKKVITPSKEEMYENRRSRSAKLRVLEKA